MALACYVVQIGARTVNGIESYFAPGQEVARSAVFGMIRIGSQVDLILPWRDGFEVRPARATGWWPERRSWCADRGKPGFVAGSPRGVWEALLFRAHPLRSAR